MQLGALAAAEKDPHNLLALVKEINHLLDERKSLAHSDGRWCFLFQPFPIAQFAVGGFRVQPS